MLKEKLELLEKLAREATPGPWKVYHPSEFPYDWRIASLLPKGRYVGRLTQSHDPKQSGNGGGGCEYPLPEDAEFIATANPSLVLALCAVAKAASATCGVQNPESMGRTKESLKAALFDLEIEMKRIVP